MKTMLFVTLFLISPALARGFCWQPPPKVCSLLFERDSVFIGTVISGQVRRESIRTSMETSRSCRPSSG